MSNKKACILINSFNYDYYLSEAIESSINQSFPEKDFEVIVVDDGSTDDTKNIVKKYKDKIKYIYKENGGQASAFNIGLEATDAEYVLFLDADDLCHPQRVEKIVSEFEKYPEVGFVLNSRQVVFSNKEVFEKHPDVHNMQLGPDNSRILAKCGYGTSRSAVRKTLLDKIKPFPQELIIEADLYMLSLLWYCRLSCLNEYLTIYRVHANNSFHTADLKKSQRKIATIKAGVINIQKAISNSELHQKKPELFKHISTRYLIEYLDLELSLHASKGHYKKYEYLKLEIEKYKNACYEWPFLKKSYKFFIFFLMVLLPISSFVKLKDHYSKLSNKI